MKKENKPEKTETNKDGQLKGKEKRLTQRRHIEELIEEKKSKKFVDEYDYYFGD